MDSQSSDRSPSPGQTVKTRPTSTVISTSPTTEPWFTGGASSDTYTLTDVAKYYWANDLRPDLDNRFDEHPTKKAFWQHMVNYIVGYGVKATMDDAANRAILTRGEHGRCRHRLALLAFGWHARRLSNR